jgi:hypothetical protein
MIQQSLISQNSASAEGVGAAVRDVDVRTKHRSLRVADGCWSGSAKLAWPISPPCSPDHITEILVVRPASALSVAQQPQPVPMAATEQIFAKMRWQDSRQVRHLIG